MTAVPDRLEEALGAAERQLAARRTLTATAAATALAGFLLLLRLPELHPRFPEATLWLGVALAVLPGATLPLLLFALWRARRRRDRLSRRRYLVHRRVRERALGEDTSP
jgi:hypothetical protein